MIKYIPFYPHDFFNDPRLSQLEPKEQQQFLFLLIKMMQTQAKMPENYKAIGRLQDISANAAQKLVIRLKGLGLLIASNTGEKLFTLTSNRLSREYEQAKVACDAAVTLAKARADKRWHSPNSS